MPRRKLSTMSIDDLRQEIQRRQKLLPKLIAQRDALSREIAALQGMASPDAWKATKAMPMKTRGRRRVKNKIGLADALAAFAKGKAKVTIGEAMDGVLAAGYKTKSASFRAVVNNMLLTDKRFKKVGRGVFTLKA